jgi:thiamine biosynthesis protein ThiS
MQLVVNGTAREARNGILLGELLGELGYGEGLVAVERNREVVPRSVQAATPLADGDVLEIVHFVGGG